MKKKKVTSVNVRSFNPTANLIFNIVIAIFAISCVVPFFFVIMISLTSEGSLAANGYRFWPKEFSLEAYRYIFQGAMSQRIIHALGITVFITVTGTIVNATMTSLYAYVISRSNFPFKKILYIVCVNYNVIFTRDGCELFSNDKLIAIERYNLGVNFAFSFRTI